MTLVVRITYLSRPSRTQRNYKTSFFNVGTIYLYVYAKILLSRSVRAICSIIVFVGVASIPCFTSIDDIKLSEICEGKERKEISKTESIPTWMQ